MYKKVRLVKGPFAGKVMESPDAGRTVITLVGPKPMTRKQKYAYEASQWKQNRAAFLPATYVWYPHVKASYQIAMRPHPTGHGVTMVPCMHPDGSLFYEYVPDSKKDY